MKPNDSCPVQDEKIPFPLPTVTNTALLLDPKGLCLQSKLD